MPTPFRPLAKTVQFPGSSDDMTVPFEGPVPMTKFDTASAESLPNVICASTGLPVASETVTDTVGRRAGDDVKSIPATSSPGLTTIACACASPVTPG